MDRKVLWIGLLSLLIEGALIAGCQSESGQGGGDLTDPKKIVATVDGTEISLGEVDRIVRIWQTNRMPGIEEMTDLDLRSKALDNLIDQKLLFAASRSVGMLPADEQVDGVMQSLQSRYPNPEAFQQALAEQELTEEAWRQAVVQDMAVRQYLVKTVPDTLRISPAMTRTYYDEHPELFETGERLHARHILVRSTPVDENAPPEEKTLAEAARERARERADSLLGALRGGADFEALAREKSDCPSASRGGDLGEFGRGQMVPPFEEAAYALEAGQMSDLVETQFGFHIIRLEERIPSGHIPYDAQLSERLAQQMRSENQAAAIGERVDSLRAAASIEREF